MSSRFCHLLLSLTLITATAYSQLPPAQPVSHRPPASPSFFSSSSSSSVAAATTGKSAVSDDRQNVERDKYWLAYYKWRVLQELRRNGTLTTRPPVSSAHIINSSTPVNISIDGKRGKQLAVYRVGQKSEPQYLTKFHAEHLGFTFLAHLVVNFHYNLVEIIYITEFMFGRNFIFQCC